MPSLPEEDFYDKIRHKVDDIFKKDEAITEEDKEDFYDEDNYKL